MNKKLKYQLLVAALVGFCTCTTQVQAQSTTTYTTPGADTWTCPAGVTSVTVTVWGGGGGGGGCNASSDGGGGGGGGGCSQSVLTVVPSTVYNLFVGAGGSGGTGQTDGSDGGESWFNTSGTLQANGGSGGLKRTTTGGLGGSGAAAGIGTTTNTGGLGRRGRNHNVGRGGGGGGGAGTTANGGGVSTTTHATAGGAGGATGGGDGGDGDGNDGSPGVTLGGGGAGAGDGSNQTGGDGARGQVDIFIPAAGDNCSNAIALTIDAACVAGSTAGTIVESGEVQPCGGAFDQSIWYSFVATATQHEVTIDNTTGGGACYNMFTALYDGSSGCVPTTPIACISDNADPQIYNYGGFSIGVTYYVQVTFGSGSCTDQTFCIDVSTAAVCTGQIACGCGALCIPVDGTCIEGSLDGAVNCLTSGCASANPSALFYFMATTTTIDVTIGNLGTDWVAGEIDVRLYSGGCSVTNVSTVCSPVPSFSNQFTGLTAGTMYSIWVSSSNGYNGANSEFGMCVTSSGSACSLGACGNLPGPSGDAYGIHSPDALGGTVSTCEIYATGGSTGTGGLVYANNSEVGTNVEISGYPTITAENISCLDTDVDYTTTDPTPVWPSGALGANATIADPADASTVSNNQYTATGRKTITFEGDVTATYAAQTFSSTVNSAIPDVSCTGVSDIINVSGYVGPIATANMSVTINIAHTYVFDCAIYLTAPNGDVINLTYADGGSGDNFTNTVFQDGYPNISTGSAPFTGTYAPKGNTTNLCTPPGAPNRTTFGAIGGGSYNPNGNWTLIVIDASALITGTFQDWSISFPGYSATTSDQTVTYPDFINMEMALPTAGTPTGSALICSGTTGNYASPDAGTLGYSYLWTTSTSGTQAVPVIGTATASSTDITFSNVSGSDIVYSVYLDITSECCGALAQVSKAVTVGSIPLPDPIVLDAAPSVCAGGTATLGVTSPDASYNYEWYLASSGGTAVSTGSSYDVTATTTATTYYVEAVTSNGCRSSPRVSVVLTGTDTPPTVPDPAAGCGPGLYTATVTSPVSGATYSWYSAAGPPPSGLLQTGLSTSYDINASSTPTLVYVTETAPGCDASTATTVTVTYTGTITVDWNGSTSTDWFTADNWNPKCVPDAGIDVTIPSVGVINNCDIQFANGGDANCKSITIDAAASLSMSDTKAVLNVHGDWTNNGIFTPVMGVVEFTGIAAQNILGSVVTLFYDLNINKSSETVTMGMGVDLVVASNLNLLDGELAINTNKITITNASNSAVGNVNGYLVSEGQTSFLEWYTDATANTYVFPFGVSGSQIPFTFKKNAAVATDIVIATWNTSPDNQTMIPVGTTLAAAKGTSQLIDRWWEITPSVALSADLTFRWTTSETSSVNYTGDPMSYHWNGSDWDNISGSAGLESITATWTSYSGGGGGGGPLPIDLWYFDAEHNAATGNVDLSWSTVSETNSEFFIVEKSRGGKDFEFVAKIPGAGTSKQTVNYSATDEDPYLGLSYYRLKRTDFDDECKYSHLVPVTIMENLQFSVWPNPAKDKLEITFGNESKGTILPLHPDKNAEIRIYDSEGRIVYNKAFDGTFYKFSIDISAFEQGMYLVTLNANNDLHTAKFVKE